MGGRLGLVDRVLALVLEPAQPSDSRRVEHPSTTSS